MLNVFIIYLKCFQIACDGGMHHYLYKLVKYNETHSTPCSLQTRQSINQSTFNIEDVNYNNQNVEVETVWWILFIKRCRAGIP